ncbi:hypothetical protein B0H13DRAFT_839420 [Mycena leptocephala]|nr:hypothetical protein B0H13DRAFT_839420 [Mycena leptocephala]
MFFLSFLAQVDLTATLSFFFDISPLELDSEKTTCEFLAATDKMGVQESQSDSTERRDNCYDNLNFFLPWENTEQVQSKATDGVGVCQCCGGVLTIQSTLPSSGGNPGTRNKQAV